VAAFRAQDAKAFGVILEGLKIRPYCGDICLWLCIKECVLECIKFCGAPKGEFTVGQIPQFAELIAKIAQDKKLVERLAAAIAGHDAELFRSLVRDLKAEGLCHVLCRWACGVFFDLRCEVLCAGRPVVERKQFIEALTIAGKAIGEFAKDRKQLESVISAAVDLNCAQLNTAVGGTEACQVVCEWICCWRCALVCIPLCREFPLALDTSIEEMRGFALALLRLVEAQDAFARLLAAVESRDAKAFAVIVREFKLEPYCLQLCAWICYGICFEFCSCVCPPPQSDTIPLFTAVGSYSVETTTFAFNPNGTTIAGGYAFTQTIPLNGLIPDGTAPVALEYRFTYQVYSATSPNPNPEIPLTGALVPQTVIGQLEYYYWDTTISAWSVQSANFYVNYPGGATVSIPQPSPTPAVVVNVNVTTDANGWIQVPQINNLTEGGQGRFVPTGTLANLDTTQITNEQFDLTGGTPPLLQLFAGGAMQTGTPSTTPPGAFSAKPLVQINFYAQTVPVVSPPTPASPVSSNSLDAIALSNTTYAYIRHPDWPGPPSSPNVSQVLVLSVDILELKSGGGCTGLEDVIHALYTAYHPYMGSCSVFLQGPQVATMTTPPGGSITLPVPNISSGATGTPFDMTALPPCAYIMWLNATLNLTSGYGAVYGTFSDYIAFCTVGG